MKYFLKRTLAYILDCLICYSLIMVVIQWAILSPIRTSIGITNEWFTNSWNVELYVLISISLPVWIYFIYFDSHKAKGTLGKRIMKLSVFDNKDVKIKLRKSFLRTALKLSPWEIIHLGLIFPTPIHFEDEPSIRILSIFGICLFIIYAVSILFINNNKQSIYDKLIGTKVVEK